MNITDQTQIEEYVLSTSGHFIDFDELSTTNEILEDFISKWGTPDSTDTSETGVTGSVWENIQTRKGAARGDLIVLEFEDEKGCLAYFSGQ